MAGLISQLWLLKPHSAGYDIPGSASRSAVSFSDTSVDSSQSTRSEKKETQPEHYPTEKTKIAVYAIRMKLKCGQMGKIC